MFSLLYKQLRFKNQWLIIPLIMAVGLFSGGIQEGYNKAIGQEYNHEESSFISIFVSVSLITAYCVFKYFTYDGDREFEEENK